MHRDSSNQSQVVEIGSAVWLGKGKRASYPLDCPAGCVAAASLVHSLSLLAMGDQMRSSPRLSWVQIFNILVYLHMWISDVSCGRHALKEVKGHVWVRIDQYRNQSPPACLCHLLSPCGGFSVVCRANKRPDNDRAAEMHLAATPSEQKENHWLSSESLHFAGTQSSVGLKVH